MGDSLIKASADSRCPKRLTYISTSDILADADSWIKIEPRVVEQLLPDTKKNVMYHLN